MRVVQKDMLLFDEGFCADICLKNKNEYVRRAAEDLAKDLSRVSVFGRVAHIIDEDELYGDAIIIEENIRPDIDPIEDESFSIVCDGKKIRISAPTYLGTMWGIYTFSEKVLGISPCYLWDDIKPQESHEFWVDSFEIHDSPSGFGFRGIFINDEDLLTGWVKSGGRREIDYPWYNDTVDVSVMDKVVETALRLKMNLVIPASFLDIDNSAERALADCVAKRGIYLSQHHIEPVGLSAFTFEKYCKKFGKIGEFSYIKNPSLMEEAWMYYAAKWSAYDNVVWQLGLRGKCDRPVWEEDIPTPDELRKYGEFIGRAISKQKEIVEKVTCGRAKHFTATLWMEGAKLAKEGFLSLPEGVVAVFADNGPDQMYANDFYSVERETGRKYGIYYHLQYFGLGPHLAPLTGLSKLCYNLKLAFDKGDRAYIIVNASNIREFIFELGAYSKMTWNAVDFSPEGYLDGYAKRVVNISNGEISKDCVKNAVNSYFDAIAVLDTSLLERHSGKFFDYRYEDVDGVKNLVIKDGMTVNACRHLLENLDKDYFSSLWTDYYEAISRSIPKYEAVKVIFEEIISKNHTLKHHFEAHWLIYTSLMLSLYKCFTALYDAKQSHKREEKLKHITVAYDAIASFIESRSVVEQGELENWYRGESKLDLKRLLAEIESVMRSLNF